MNENPDKTKGAAPTLLGAVLFSGIQQIALFLMAAFATFFGDANGMICTAIASFMTLVTTIVVGLRPGKPTATTIAIISWSYLPLLGLVVVFWFAYKFHWNVQ